MKCLAFLLGTTSSVLIAGSCFADSIGANAEYSWMLPKTVIDAEIVYTFKKCTANPEGITLSFNVAPTLTPRAVPDLAVGRLEINVNDLPSFSKDRNIAIATSAGSHILGSIGSSPADQTASVIGNILGGVTKLAGIALGVSGGASVKIPPSCSDDPKGPNALVGTIKTDTDTIDKLETAISQMKKLDGTSPLDETTLKEYVAQIQALQTLVTEAQKKITLTIKGTIDPGFGFSRDTAPPHPNTPPTQIDKTGLIATIQPTDKELIEKKWFKVAPDPAGSPLLINVYMDFEQAILYLDPEHAAEWKALKSYTQTPLKKAVAKQPATMDLYRDVAYIPVLIWKGDKYDVKCKSQDLPPSDDDDTPTPTCPKQLAAPRTLPFAQYGFAQRLPVDAPLFQSLSWAVTFTEFGEIANATFSTKASGNIATSLFGSAASAASSIASEQQKAAAAGNPTAQAAEIQGQADLIYEGKRLALCQAHPSSCPSK